MNPQPLPPCWLCVIRVLVLLCVGLFLIASSAEAETIKNPDGTTTKTEKVNFKPPKKKKIDLTRIDPPTWGEVYAESSAPPPPPFWGEGRKHTTRDKDGNVIKEEWFDANGTLRQSIFYERKAGQTTITSYGYRDDKTPSWKSEEVKGPLGDRLFFEEMIYRPNGQDVTSGWRFKDGEWYAWDSQSEKWVKTHQQPPAYLRQQSSLPPQPSEGRPEQNVFFPASDTTAEVFFVSFVGGNNNDTVTRTREVERERTERETFEVPRTVQVFDGVGFRTQTVIEPTTIERTIRESERVSYQQNTGLYDDYAVGGGIGVSRFAGDWGFGGEFAMLSGHSPIYSLNASLIYRRPIVVSGARKPFAVAPYVFAGCGGQFGDEDLFTGHVGAGVELRFSSRFGIFADARWTCGGGDDNWATIRTGVRIPFGPAPAPP